MAVSSPPLSGNGEQGFSLIEVLVALTILSIAGAALIRVSQDHAGRLEQLEAVMLADRVASNRLTELRVFPFATTLPSYVVMGDISWRIEVSFLTTTDPDLSQTDIAVYRSGENVATSRLTGFIDTGRRT